ncbi:MULTISPECIES: flagellar hook-length control protein FliK [unclassified Sphingomonas]|uniref:flagellar hook-length control protein FliK n=1 Tax=unclassified Sphingomonas TaxID=196159 RepID=UPI0006FFEB84|nr:MULTISPECIES: flagellar hook-length control protein FliK [unclassified Sphingomonas]KQN21514.1 hypothetical protein ASE89_00395 [Sphingomonas sp. Leaf30]MBD8552284.1 flagellar hook-length control protein FliK [Sphingomonas sp. CFBP 8764]
MIQPALALTPSPAAPAAPATRGAEPTVAFGAALAGVIDAAGRRDALPLLPAAPVTANRARQPLAADGNPLPVAGEPAMSLRPGSDGLPIVATPSWPPQPDGASPAALGPDLPPAPPSEFALQQGTPPLPNHALRAGLRAAVRDGADPASEPADTEQPSTDAEQAPLVATPNAPTAIIVPLLAMPVPEPVPEPVPAAVADAAPPPLPAPSAGLTETPRPHDPAITPPAIPIAPRAPAPMAALPRITDAAPLRADTAPAPPAVSIGTILAPGTSAPVAPPTTAVPTMIDADALARSVEDARGTTTANVPQQPQGQPQAQPPLQPGTIASAAQVFGAAIQAAARRRDEPDEPGGAPALGAFAPVMTAASGVSAQPPLDMRQERWPSAMIERIDILRDAANATDTRIRLIPDALGTIDVSVRRDGDTVHVQFAAEQAATRSLLQEAQPRLAELADARGMKLTQSNVDTGAGQQQQQQQRAATPHQPSAPARARAGTATAADTDSTDTRLA